MGMRRRSSSVKACGGWILPIEFGYFGGSQMNIHCGSYRQTDSQKLMYYQVMYGQHRWLVQFALVLFP